MTLSIDHRKRKTLLRREWLITAVISFALLAGFVYGGISRTLGDVLYDHLMRLHGFRATHDIVLISVDDRSLDALGGWPLKRGEYAKLLSQLNDDRYRPKAIGFDLLFLDPTPDDSSLATAMAPMKVVLPLEFQIHEEGHSSHRSMPPVAPLARVSRWGHINLTFDPDGVIRGFQTQDHQHPHFALQLHTLGEPDHQPLSTHGYRRFRMVDPQVGFPTVSLSDALQDNALRTLFKDKYVLVGVTAPSLGDHYPTLYSGQHNSGTPGVAILASILNASLHEALIQEASKPIVMLWAAGLLSIMLLSLMWLRPYQMLGVTMMLIVMAVAVSYGLLTQKNYWLDPTPIIPIAALLQPIWSWRRLQAMVRVIGDSATDLHRSPHGAMPLRDLDPSREVVLQSASLLDHAVASAKSELSLLSSIIDQMPDAILIFDADERVLLGNKKITTVMDAQHVAVGMTLSDVASHLKLPLHALTEVVRDVPSSAPPVRHIETLRGHRDFYIKSDVVNSPAGDVLRIVILTDITELRQSQTQRDRALQFLSHDMRTPLASILSLTRPHAPVNSDSLTHEKIVHHANALLHMMDDFILTISAEAPQYNVRQELLENILHDALTHVSDLAAIKAIELRYRQESPPVFVMVDTRLMIRALVNLLYNAVKFSPKHSTVSLDIKAPEGAARVTIGIENLVDIREDALDLTPSMPGFGLGLNFVDMVIAKHGGTIERHIPTTGLAKLHITLPCLDV